MKIRKIMCAFLAAAIALAGFAGCGSKKESVKPITEESLDVPYDVTAKITVAITADPIEKTLINALAEGFRQQYYNVTVEPVIIQGEYVKELGNRFAAEKNKPGSVPDILFANSETSYSLISYGLFENLDSCLEYETEKNGEYIGQFYDYFMKLGQEGLDGSQYILPRSADRVVTHLNTRILGEAGVDMTKVKNGWTWEDFLEVCRTVRTFLDENGMNSRYVIDSYVNWEAVMYPIFRSFGVEIFDGKGNVTLDDASNVAGAQVALDLMKELVDERYIAPLNSDGSANFEGGQGAMMFHSAPVYKYKGILGDDYDIVTFPLIGETPKIGAGLAGYGIFSGSANKAVAWKFLSYMLSREGQETLAEGGSTCLPIRTDMADPQTNKWSEKYRDMNMEAYSYRMDYNQATDFYLPFEASAQADVISDLSDLVVSYLGGDSFGKAVSTFKIAIGNL